MKLKLFSKSEPAAIRKLREVVAANEADHAAACKFAEKEAEISAGIATAAKAFLADPTPAKAQRFVEAERQRLDLAAWRETFRLANLAADGSIAARTHEPIGAALVEVRNQLAQKIAALRVEDATRTQELGLDAAGDSPAVTALLTIQDKAAELHGRWLDGGLDPGRMTGAIRLCLGQ